MTDKRPEAVVGGSLVTAGLDSEVDAAPSSRASFQFIVPVGSASA